MTRVCPICNQKAIVTWGGRLVVHRVPRCPGSDRVVINSA